MEKEQKKQWDAEQLEFYFINDIDKMEDSKKECDN